MFHSLKTVKETMLLGYSILNLDARCSPMTYFMIVWDIHAVHMCTEKWKSVISSINQSCSLLTLSEEESLKSSLDIYKDTEALIPIRIHLPCILSSTARYQEGKESSVTPYYCLCLHLNIQVLSLCLKGKSAAARSRAHTLPGYVMIYDSALTVSSWIR